MASVNLGATVEDENSAPPAPEGLGGTIASTGTSTAPQKGSGSFTNLREYIRANRPKTAQMGNQISQGIEQRGQAVKSSLDTAKAGIGAGSALANEEQRVNVEANKPFIQQTIQQAGASPSTQADQDRFRSYYQGTPTQLSAPDVNQGLAQSKELQRQAGQIGTTEGRLEQLRGIVGRQAPATYSRGQKTLDQLLMARDKPVQQDMIARARAAASGLTPEQFQSVSKEFSNRITPLAGQREALAQLAQSGIGSANTDLQNAITQKEAQEQSQYDALKAFQDQSRFTTGQPQDVTINPAIMQQLGLNLSGRLYGVDPSQYANLPGAAPTLENVTTPEQLARLQALSQLSGQDYAGSTQVGGYTQGTFDTSGFEAKRAQGLSDYTTQKAELDRLLAYKPPLPTKDGGGNYVDPVYSTDWFDKYNKTLQDQVNKLSPYTGAINPDQQYLQEQALIQKQIEDTKRRLSEQSAAESQARLNFDAATAARTAENLKNQQIAAAALANPIATGAVSLGKKLKKKFK